MRIHELCPAPGSKKNRKRVGRGTGSGHGKTACRGSKGQKARSGGSIAPGFEGGQMPLQRRLPKRGFRNAFKKQYALVSVKDLSRFPAGSSVELDGLARAGLVRDAGDGVKVLGGGELSHALTVRVTRVSKTAREKIEAAGGRVELV